MQSKTWAFDLIAYEADRTTELLACEKKSAREIETLLKLMAKHCQTPVDALSGVQGAERNAFKKIVGLRRSRPRTFWALGPANQGHVFDVEYADAGEISLRPSTAASLVYGLGEVRRP